MSGRHNLTDMCVCILSSKKNSHPSAKKKRNMGKRLNIKNYDKILGLSLYEPGVWEPLQTNAVRPGARCTVSRVFETVDKYEFVVALIRPQPLEFRAAIWRAGITDTAGFTKWLAECDGIEGYFVSEALSMGKVLLWFENYYEKITNR